MRSGHFNFANIYTPTYKLISNVEINKKCKMIVLKIILVIIDVFLGACYWIQKRSHFAKLLNAFPQAGPLIPIVGHLYLLSTKPDVLFSKLRKMLKKFNQTFAFWGGMYGTLQVVTADDAEIILMNVKHLDKGLLYLVFKPWLQNGLLTSTWKQWHQRRKMLNPAFHYNMLQMFIDKFGEQCENLKETLKEECTKTKTNINPIIAKMTLSTICETSMGVKLDQNTKHLKSYYDALHSITEIFVNRVFCPWLHPNFIYNATPSAWRENKLVKYLHKFTSDIIKTREENFQAEDLIELESTDKISKKRLTMLDLLLHAKNLGEIDDAGIREEVDTFVFAGHDTIAIAACYALMTLANNKLEQNKIIEELDEAFGDSQRDATFDDLQNMKYLERCIKECLRLYPSVPLIGRILKEDIPLSHHIAPAGTEVLMHIYNIHRDPKYYPDPEKFDPDRFLPEKIKERPFFAYIPFSAGPRNCIGQKYAMLEMKVLISTILRNFTMEPIDSVEDLTWIVDLVLRTKEPIHIKFNPRNIID